MTPKRKLETPIEEIHRIRREIADRFGGDIAAIAADAAQRSRQSGRPMWQPKTTIPVTPPQGTGNGSDDGRRDGTSD